MNRRKRVCHPMRVWDASHNKFEDYRRIPMQQRNDPASPYSVNWNTGLSDFCMEWIHEFDLIIDLEDVQVGVYNVKCVCCKAEEGFAVGVGDKGPWYLDASSASHHVVIGNLYENEDLYISANRCVLESILQEKLQEAARTGRLSTLMDKSRILKSLFEKEGFFITVSKNQYIKRCSGINDRKEIYI